MKKTHLASEPTRISEFGDISEVSSNQLSSPLNQLTLSTNLSPFNCAEAIIAWFQAEFGTDEFIDAQREFHNLMGKVFHDDSNYHQRVHYFLDYFLFSRKVKRQYSPKTPLDLFTESKFFNSKITLNESQDLIKSLSHSRHSLFLIHKVRKSNLIVKDLLMKNSYLVSPPEGHVFEGFHPGSILQGFILSFGDKFFLSRGIFIHPSSVNRTIKSYITKSLKKLVGEENIISNLAKRNVDIIRHRNIDPKQIYKKRLL